MPDRPQRACASPVCPDIAIIGSIYCAKHQTKDSAGNRTRRRPQRKESPQAVASSDPVALDAAMARFDDEDLDGVKIPD
jgi:hypothetical protein